MSSIYIAIGANLGDPTRTLLSLPERLARYDISVRARSSLWQNPAWPADQGYPDYINGVMEVEYEGEAAALLECLNAIEAEAGRNRSTPNAPRELDLDIIDFKGATITSERLSLPHPRLQNRAFVLLPLAEIAPDWRHPVSGQHILELLGQIASKDMDAMRLVMRWVMR